MSNLVKQALAALIRPPRKEYSVEDLPLDLKVDETQSFHRFPVSLKNRRNQNLVASIYHASSISPYEGGPCVIYLHGNASSQLEGQFLVPNLCPYGFFVVCWDFAGCGCSGGEYISLGYFEKEDTEFLMDVLHRTFHLGPFVLWGRSMGAATSLLVMHPMLQGRVIDSAFTSIQDMCTAISVQQHLPQFFVPAAIWFIQKKVLSVANFSITAVAPISVDHAGCEVPACFGHATYDAFIPFEQCQRLYSHYQCDRKYLMALPGGHNSMRMVEWLKLGVLFIFECFGKDKTGVKISAARMLQKSDDHFGSFADMIKVTKAPESDALLDCVDAEGDTWEPPVSPSVSPLTDLDADAPPSFLDGSVPAYGNPIEDEEVTGREGVDARKGKRRKHHSKRMSQGISESAESPSADFLELAAAIGDSDSD
jgi:pimeloyl-ACP methyl ester carboxylesterase